MDTSKISSKKGELPCREEAFNFLYCFSFGAECFEDLEWRLKGAEYVGWRRYIAEGELMGGVRASVARAGRFPSLDIDYLNRVLDRAYSESEAREGEREQV